ncbi:hypothetical protein [Actinoplanes siamensis]|uniref:Uncharacterized protein n=1 Tax=Actinoplanes siamensis TaxID=1223317 RepID=A0A919N675_9ACTN|nr:hypothetical protein [Actinoplanes siamensis]GIF05194.1 hypothetical protein Asi03nite_27320 [Actinoplanes siamensis]
MGLDARPAVAGQDQKRFTPVRRQLRKPRHAGLVEAVHRLDAGLDTATRAQLDGWIRAEYESEFGDVPLGMFALCHLGPPYIDHRLDLFQSIVEHYAPADPVPEPFARARMLVRTGAYDFVEVYASGELRPVLHDGSVAA